jgi:hypothetical protein
MCIISLLARLVYFLSNFAIINTEIKATLFVLPGTFTLGIAITQINIYV